MTSATIILTGITYLLLTPKPPYERLQVAVTSTIDARDNLNGHAIPRHIAFIMVPHKDVDYVNTKRPIDYQVSRIGSIYLEDIFLLHREALTFVNVDNKLVVPSDQGNLPLDRSPLLANTPLVKNFCTLCGNLAESSNFIASFSKDLGATIETDYAELPAVTRRVLWEGTFGRA